MLVQEIIQAQKDESGDTERCPGQTSEITVLFDLTGSFEPHMILHDQMKNLTENRSLGSSYIKSYYKTEWNRMKKFSQI